MNDKLPNQRWRIAPQQTDKVTQLVETTGLDPLIAQVLVNRHMETPKLAQVHIDPETQELPAPMQEFPDLAKSVAILKNAILSSQKIAICGDYDADGMTSTALLLRALRHLGADVDYAIPSRMKDGYGINIRIVEEFAKTGIGLILTVDNGISAYEAIARAVELGMKVIITDHHDLPEKLPPADAILNPKLIAESSPYRGLAGVGVAYILAVTTARTYQAGGAFKLWRFPPESAPCEDASPVLSSQSLGVTEGLSDLLLELFTLGTIADLAPLVGVNRRWLKRGLRKLPQSKLPGIQALIKMAGVSDEQKQLQPDDIGFKLGPRINAIGRIGDPQIVIELLTTDDESIALTRAIQCEQCNRQRQELCEQIELEAIALVEETPIDWQQNRVLVVVNDNWHHGVIGIVASRLVERYGVPVFIATYEEEDETLPDQGSARYVRDDTSIIRGSARGTEEFNIFAALEFCDDLLSKYGGHKAAGGFGFPASNLDAFKERLSQFAHQCLELEHLKPLIKIDAQASFDHINLNLYQQIDSLQPWGIGNDFPVFWTPNVRIIEQKLIGASKNHLKFTLAQDDNLGGRDCSQSGSSKGSPCRTIKALAWRWGEYFPLPNVVDIAYKLKENNWQNQTSVELEIVGVRLPFSSSVNVLKKFHSRATHKAEFSHNGRVYLCNFWELLNELRIRNDRGLVLSVNCNQQTGLLGTSRENAEPVDITKPHYHSLIEAALVAIEKTKI